MVIITFLYNFKLIELSIKLDELQYEDHLKIISYIIDSIYIQKENNNNKNKDKNSGSSKNIINSSSDNSDAQKNVTDTITNEGKKIIGKNLKNRLKLIIALRPNTFGDTKLLTITMIDYTEMLTENQLKNIVQYAFNNIRNSLRESVPLNQNSESIIINANINIVFYFFANWRTHLVEGEIVKNIKFNGDPKIPGSTLEITYLNKYKIKVTVEEVNSFFQQKNEDDDNEWNYKYTIEGNKGESETLNCIFISCENGTKTFVSVENDINKNIGIEKMQELSKRKLGILTNMKNYIENNLEKLKNLGNDVY